MAAESFSTVLVGFLVRFCLKLGKGTAQPNTLKLDCVIPLGVLIHPVNAS